MLTEEDFQIREQELSRQIVETEEQKLQITNKLQSLIKEREDLRMQYSLLRLKYRPVCSTWIEQFPWTEKLRIELKRTFNFERFRPQQLAAINATMSNQDVLLILPTGGGKSLVYQLPSIINKKLTIVISPLISLIEDQLLALRKIGINAETVNSSISKEVKKIVMSKLSSSALNIIFVTPEWMAQNKTFRKCLTKLHTTGYIERFVIDEVHCCSQWGHDFRTDYLSLSLLKGQFPGIPILGLTATATPRVLVEVQKILQIPDSVVLSAPFNRPNLFYQVKQKSEEKLISLDYLENLLRDKYKAQSGIIYVGTQKESEDLASYLKNRGLKAAPYHANLESHMKTKIHKRWIQEIYQIVVATVAFGMGIDKPNVRFVIHYTVPRSMEGFYQESGRAGRDGQKSDCVLMFSLGDWLKIFAMTQNKRQEKGLTDVLLYSTDVINCRRKLISKHFEDDWRSTDCREMCDRCNYTQKLTLTTYNVTESLVEIVQIIDIAALHETNVTLKRLLDSWFKQGPKKLHGCGTTPSFTRDQAKYIIAFFLSKDFLVVRRGYNLVSSLPYIDSNIEEVPNREIHMDYPGTIEGIPIASQSDDNEQNETVWPIYKVTKNKIKIRSRQCSLDLTGSDEDGSSSTSSETSSTNSNKIGSEQSSSSSEHHGDTTCSRIEFVYTRNESLEKKRKLSDDED